MAVVVYIAFIYKIKSLNYYLLYINIYIREEISNFINTPPTLHVTNVTDFCKLKTLAL